MTRFFQQFRYLLLTFALLFAFSAYAMTSHPELGMMLSATGHTVFKMAYKGHIDATPEGGTSPQGLRPGLYFPRRSAAPFLFPAKQL